MPSPTSKVNTRSSAKRRPDIDVYSHPFNAKFPGDVAKALSINTNMTPTGVNDAEKTCTTPVKKSPYPAVLPLWSPSQSSSSSSSSTENEISEVDFHTPIFGIAYDVAMSLLDSEDDSMSSNNNTPRPKRFLLRNLDSEHPSPSSDSDTILPDSSDDQRSHPAYAARARWLDHRDEEKKKLRNISGRRQVSRNWEPNRIGEYHC